MPIFSSPPPLSTQKLKTEIDQAGSITNLSMIRSRKPCPFPNSILFSISLTGIRN